ncbi:polysaccharide pyruvyl transferase family protein [Zhihengliuella halotolerans]|uniref:Polysaccharide pyruvyl transferase CsaB n=1 Tax=Zhihengliuella halotolerans TaxID=370736 RepID=A0A4Q8ACW0_9MICC|nr:polysaccharide pyruvyl transferase family protein [Zhihengliuella halotolerans]RZU61581.1 polysaccharide pyruvyl transferase CsaB [Zhihengliuella halotolerans]
MIETIRSSTGERPSTAYSEIPLRGSVLVGDFSDEFSMERIFLDGLMDHSGAVAFVSDSSVTSCLDEAEGAAVGRVDCVDLASLSSFSAVVWVVAGWTARKLNMLEAAAAALSLHVVDLSVMPDLERQRRLQAAGAEVHTVHATDVPLSHHLSDVLQGTTRRPKPGIAFVTAEWISARHDTLVSQWNETFGLASPLERVINPTTSEFVELISRGARLAMPEPVRERPRGWQLLVRIADAAGVPVDVGVSAFSGGQGGHQAPSESNVARGTGSPEAERRFVVLCGWFGADNLGDELILEQTLDVITQIRPDLVPLVISVDPARTLRRHGVPALTRGRFDELHAALGRSAGLVYCGGGLFQDYDFAEQGGVRGLVMGARGSINGYGSYARLARSLGVPVYFYAQGVGPLRTQGARSAFREAISSAASFSVRDRHSAREWAAATGGGGAEVVADPVFAAVARIPSAGFAENGGIAVNLRPWPFAADVNVRQLLVEACSHASTIGTFVRGVPVSTEDFDYLNRLKSELADVGYHGVEGLEIVAPVTTRDGLRSALDGVGTAIGMRLHFCMISMMLGVPTTGVAYDPKVSSVFAELSPDSVVPVAELDSVDARRNLFEARACTQRADTIRAKAAGRGDQARREMEEFWRFVGRQTGGQGLAAADS